MTAVQVLERTTVPQAVAADRSVRRRRAVLVTSALGMVVVALFILTMMIGSYVIAPWDVIASALHLRSDPSVDFIVRDLRLPVAATGLSVGLALGVSGMLFQKLLANPLASPDFVGRLLRRESVRGRIDPPVHVGGPASPWPRSSARWSAPCWCTSWRGATAYRDIASS